MEKSRSDETRCAITTLTGFRAGLHQCWTSWPDAAFELTDTVLCMPSPVASVPAQPGTGVPAQPRQPLQGACPR